MKLPDFLKQCADKSEKAHHEINSLAQAKHEFKMSIPVNMNHDSDMVLQAPLDCIPSLLEIIEIQREALEFYATSENWEGKEDQDIEIVADDWDTVDDFETMLGGKHARDAISAVEKLIGGIE